MVRKRIYKRKTGRFRRRSRMRMRKPSKMAFAKGKATYSRGSRSLFRKMQAMAEMKVTENGYTDVITNAGYVSKFQVPSAGTGNGQRIGSKIFCRYILIKGFFKGANGTQSPLIRASLVWPKDTSYYNPTLGPAGYNNFWNHKNFTVMWDKTYKLGTGMPLQASVASGSAAFTYVDNGFSPNVVPVFWKIKVMKNLEFDSQNNLTTVWPFVYIYTENPLGGSETAFSYNTRMYFTDV